MTDDIVTRLRMPYDQEGTTDKLEMEAADEIERLNKLVTTWIICAERLVESQEGKEYDKALNFYRDCQRIANETC